MNQFERVVQILDAAVGGPAAGVGFPHGPFWRGVTRDQFVAKKVQGLDLLVVGNGAGSNLVKALKGEAPFGADLDNPPPGARFDRMPSGLPPVAPGDIAFIQQWIDQGCLQVPYDPPQHGGAATETMVSGMTSAAPLEWRPTNAPVASSRTDDIWFTDPQTGWAVNSNGQIIHTTDGGETWVEQFHDPDVYFRCIGFASPTRGWAGTLTAHKTLYETRDGGTTWSIVSNLPPLAPSAVCGLSVVNENTVYLSGTNFPNRPPRMMKTLDGGTTWTAWEMRPWASILIDTYFSSPERGWVVGGKTDEPIATRNNVKAVVLLTEDGGKTWTNRLAGSEGLPLGEWCWKIQFLDDRIGFVSLENFTQGAILKTLDGGATWARIPVTDPQMNANLEGIGFLDERHGWVGGWGDAQFQRLSTSETIDGGQTWRDANEIGKALNRFRFFGNPVTVGYASGQTVYKYASQPVLSKLARRAPRARLKLLADNQPQRALGTLKLPIHVPAGVGRLTVRVWDRFGDHVATPLDEAKPPPGLRSVEWDWDHGRHGPGYFIVRVTADGTSESQLVHVGSTCAQVPQVRSSIIGERSLAIASHVALPGSERRLMPGSTLMGAPDVNHRIEVTLKLRRKAPIPDMPGRPQVPLTRNESAAKYGASQDDIAKVTDVLKRYGLEVLRWDQATRSVVVAGPINAFEKAFLVKLFRYAHQRGDYRGRSGMVHIPAELAEIVVGVYGLDNRKVIQRQRRRPEDVQLSAANLTTATQRGFLPGDLAKIYAFPDGDGAGQTIGIVEFGGRIEADALTLFCNRIGVSTPRVLEIDVDGGAADPGDAPSGEVMLDIEIVVGLCPKATIPVYFGPAFDERSWIDTIDQAVHDAVNNPSVLSISWGNFEDGPAWQQTSVDHVNDVFKEAAMMGVTVCVASGDDGSDDQGGDGRAHVDFPASSPYVLAVGGTDLRARDGVVTERAWKDGDGLRADGFGSSGGGVSSHFPRPSFQQDISIVSVNPGAILGRVVPDVAAHAQSDGRRTGYFYVVDGTFGPVAGVNGGTSAAAPLWAALIGRINAALQQQMGADKRVGYLTPVLYNQGADGAPVGSTVCKDITVGDNISAAIGGYRAAAGYDAVTGWGSPIGTQLLAVLSRIV